MKRKGIMLLAPVALAALACAGPATGESHTLVFQGDASFHGPHGGQVIRAALVGPDTTIVESDTVSATAVPAFEVRFDNAIKPDGTYEVDYWIDSNFGGGTEGVCDATAHDHQWRVQLPPIGSDTTYTDTHRPTETTNVCDVFASS